MPIDSEEMTVQILRNFRRIIQKITFASRMFLNQCSPKRQVLHWPVLMAEGMI